MAAARAASTRPSARHRARSARASVGVAPRIADRPKLSRYTANSGPRPPIAVVSLSSTVPPGTRMSRTSSVSANATTLSPALRRPDLDADRARRPPPTRRPFCHAVIFARRAVATDVTDLTTSTTHGILPPMTRYLVLLRGINVGGKNKVPMAALRDLLESHGHTKVSTYIASGNVILSSDQSAAAIKRELEDGAPEDLQARQRADRGPGPDPGPASRGRPEAAEGLRRPSGHVPQRRGLPHRHRRADGDAGLRPAARRRRGVAGNRRHLLAAAERPADQEPARQDRRDASLQVDDDPQLADDDGAARADGGSRARSPTAGRADGPRPGMATPASGTSWSPPR